MPKIIINPNEVVIAGTYADNAKRKVVSVNNGVREISDRLNAQVRGRNGISSKFNSLVELLESIETKITRLKTTVENTADNYRRTDSLANIRARDLK